MREDLEEANVVTVTLSSSQVQWIRKGQEAIIKGNLFDVKGYRIVGDQILLTGLFDKDEDLLVAYISDIQQRNNPDKTNNSSMVFEWLSCFYLFIKTNDLNPYYTIIRNQYLFPSKTEFQSINPVIDPPPPKSGYFLS